MRRRRPPGPFQLLVCRAIAALVLAAAAAAVEADVFVVVNTSKSRRGTPLPDRRLHPDVSFFLLFGSACLPVVFVSCAMLETPPPRRRRAAASSTVGGGSASASIFVTPHSSDRVERATARSPVSAGAAPASFSMARGGHGG